MRDWLQADADIPDEPEIDVDLTGPDYFFSPKGQIQLEPKDTMKARGLDSPDIGDCLAMSHSVKVAARSLFRSRNIPIPAFRILRAGCTSRRYWLQLSAISAFAGKGEGVSRGRSQPRCTRAFPAFPNQHSQTLARNLPFGCCALDALASRWMRLMAQFQTPTQRSYHHCSCRRDLPPRRRSRRPRGWLPDGRRRCVALSRSIRPSNWVST
jgi:hypothetical protein